MSAIMQPISIAISSSNKFWKQTLNYTVFDSTACLLGESAFWHPERKTFLWLDILAKKIFEKAKGKDVVVHQFELTPSAIVSAVAGNGVVIVCDQGILSYDLDRRHVTDLTPISLQQGYRTNDAGLDPVGRVVFGSMEHAPSGLNGMIYRVEETGDIMPLLSKVGIPNTFVWSDDGRKIYFADSYKQEMYVADYGDEGITNVAPLYNLVGGDVTPDGSVIIGGKLLNAEWNGARVAVRSIVDGQEKAEIPLPVMRPTSCAVGGEELNELLITSSAHGLSADQLNEYPHSGKTLVVSLADIEL
jgi:L-arabinonolactonase